MKLITRCPECQTAFRVHENQLAARQGKVRCGACGFVFDAFASLVEVIQEKRQPAEQAAVNRTSDADGPLQAGASAAMAEVTLAAGAATIWPRMNEMTRAVRAPEPKAEPDSQSQDMVVRADGSVALGQPSGRPSQMLGPPSSAEQFDFGTAPDEPASNLKWKVGIAVLALALVIQIAFGLRGMIAAMFPVTHPAIASICKALHCRVPLPRNAEQLVLEASDLQSDQVNAFELTATIRNRANYAQGYPALLLTLTDERNRPIARRVIHPMEYLGRVPTTTETIPAGGKVSGRVLISGQSINAAGYEVLVFYP